MGETIHFLYLMLLMSLYCIVFFAYCRCEPLLAQRIVLGELEKLGVFLSPNFKQLRMFELAERDDIYQSAIQMAASLPPPRPQQPTVMTQAGQHCFFVLVYCLNNTVEIICPPINLCIHPFIIIQQEQEGEMEVIAEPAAGAAEPREAEGTAVLSLHISA